MKEGALRRSRLKSEMHGGGGRRSFFQPEEGVSRSAKTLEIRMAIFSVIIDKVGYAER